VVVAADPNGFNTTTPIPHDWSAAISVQAVVIDPAVT
jgi:hypothetical protein